MAGVVGWRIAAWLIVLVAGVGAFFYARDAIVVSLALHGGSPDIDAAAAHVQLIRDIASFIAAVALAVLAVLVLGGKRRAVLPLRLACLLVAVWAATGVFALWRSIAQLREGLAALAPSDASGDLSHVVGSILMPMYVSLGLQVLIIPVLGWVAWRLGKPDVSPA